MRSRIDLRMVGEEGQRVARVLDLLQADHAAEFAFALAAAAHVETQHDVAELAEHLGRLHRIRRGLVAAEPVQHDEGGAPLARPHPARDMHDPRQLESGGRKGDGLFGHRHGLRGGRKAAGDFIELTRGWKQGFCHAFRSSGRCRSSRQMQERACSGPGWPELAATRISRQGPARAGSRRPGRFRSLTCHRRIGAAD